MPRETINSEAADGKMLSVSVGWGRDDYVQIATEWPDEPNQSTQGNGWWVLLERDQINKLIRTLRRARDQAFGRDE